MSQFSTPDGVAVQAEAPSHPIRVEQSSAYHATHRNKAEQNGSAPRRAALQTPAASEYKPRIIDADKAERATLRGIISDNSDMLDHALRYLNPSNWQNSEYRIIAEAVWTCHYKHSKRDAETVEALLLSEKETEAAAALNALILPMPEPSRDEFHDAAHTVQNWKKLLIEKRPNRFQLLSLKEIFTRPRPLWLVDEMLLEFGTSAMTGGYGSFKSFVALDIGLSIATGRAWHGRDVKRGTVVYVVAEGAYTTHDRVKAWCIRHKIEGPENFHVVEIPVQIGDALVCAEFIEAIAEAKPVFIVLDTLAKCNVGADENSSRDMGLFTHGMQEVATEMSAQVLTIHHNNKSGDTRGSNALPSNVDTHITAKATGGNVVTLECEKTKVAPFEKFSLIGRGVELGEQDKKGREITSLVFDPTDAPPVEAVDRADTTREKVLQVLAEMPEGARATAWQLECARLKIAARSRFYDYRDDLVQTGRVIKTNDVYFLGSPISPISPIRTKSEPKNKSDSSDDALASDESDYMAGFSDGVKISDGTLPEMPPETAQPNRKAQSEPYTTTLGPSAETAARRTAIMAAGAPTHCGGKKLPPATEKIRHPQWEGDAPRIDCPRGPAILSDALLPDETAPNGPREYVL